MFRNSKIVELFSCGNTKCSYIINFGSGPCFQSFFDQVHKEAPYFACSFDESFNNTIKKGQMGLSVSGIILQTWSKQGTTTANFWEMKQLWMYTQNSNHVQSHLAQAK